MSINAEHLKAANAHLEKSGMKRYGWLPHGLRVAFHQGKVPVAQLRELGEHFAKIGNVKSFESVIKTATAKLTTSPQAAFQHLLQEAAKKAAAHKPLHLALTKYVSPEHLPYVKAHLPVAFVNEAIADYEAGKPRALGPKIEATYKSGIKIKISQLDLIGMDLRTIDCAHLNVFTLPEWRETIAAILNRAAKRPTSLSKASAVSTALMRIVTALPFQHSPHSAKQTKEVLNLVRNRQKMEIEKPGHFTAAALRAEIRAHQLQPTLRIEGKGDRAAVTLLRKQKSNGDDKGLIALKIEQGLDPDLFRVQSLLELKLIGHGTQAVKLLREATAG